MGDSGDTDEKIIIEEFAQVSSYLPPAQCTIDEILKKDNEDESLKRYKNKLLLGNTTGNLAVVEPDNPSNVILKRLSVVVNGEVKTFTELPAKQEFTLRIKEESPYKIQIQFYVQRGIVSGLKYLHKVSRLGFGLTKELYMIGSYGPSTEIHTYESPVEEAPSGLLSRGKYHVCSLVTDDDMNRWLEWKWNIEIVKDW